DARTQSAGPDHQPEEDGRGGDRRLRRRHDGDGLAGRLLAPGDGADRPARARRMDRGARDRGGPLRVGDEAGGAGEGQLGADSGARGHARPHRRAAARDAGVLLRAPLRVAGVAMKRIAILGSTGSIGTSALAVVDAYPDRLAVAGLAASTSVDALARQAARYRPAIAAIASESCADALRAGAPPGTAVATGPGGLLAV